MKNINGLILILVFSLVLVACDNSKGDNQAAAPKQDSTPAAVESSSAATQASAAAPEAAPAGSPMAATMEVGKAVYMRNCVACHQPNGKGIPPAFPSIAGSAVALGDVNAQIQLILNGKTGTAMVSFAQQLSDQEIAGVITYQRNSFGNSTGDLVTTEQVSAQR